MNITTLKNKNLVTLLETVLAVSHVSEEWDNKCVELVDLIFELDDYINLLENNQETGREE